LNSPYPASDDGGNVYYSTFTEPPKHLDPAVSYSSDEYAILGLVYEPPLQYHYLKRPYQLVPATAVSVPKPVMYGADGKRLPAGSPSRLVARTVYEIRIKPGIMFAPHPCFARDGQGKPLYGSLAPDSDVRRLSDLPKTDTRELTAADYVTQTKRLADPTLNPGCPILPVMAKYVMGLSEYSRGLRRDLEEERARRRKAGGPLYNAERDERLNPIRLDLGRRPLPGSVAVDRYTWRLTIKGNYPQILYWLAMPFFSPMPEEALSFYSQAPLARRNIGLNRYPVGTGPYRIAVYNPNREITLVRNERFHGETYPADGSPGDRKRGLLADSGKPVPFIDKIVLKLEKEAIPRWTKFLQGYYDASGIPEESFDTAVNILPEGTAEVSSLFRERGLRLEVDIQPTTYYFAFNMLDPVFGGYSERQAKLRRAVAIAIDTEERIQIFNNGRGVPAMSIIPPGIFGYEEGKPGIDPYVYRWDDRTKSVRRRTLAEAKRLLVEAGYPGGRSPDGRALALRFANSWNTPDAASIIRWLEMKLAAIGIRLDNETTDYNRFQEKAAGGNFQVLFWGWNADYPDPENFLFLLYGPNSQKNHQGENHSNYENPEYDRLFRELETMADGSARLKLIRRALEILRRDAPMVGGFHPVAFGLYHSWLKNTKPIAIANNTLKYQRIDTVDRDLYRREHNRPVLWPVLLAVLAVAALIVPAVLSLSRMRAQKPPTAVAQDEPRSPKAG